MYCTNCGEELQEGMKFCPNCGTKTGVMTVQRKKKKGIVITKEMKENAQRHLFSFGVLNGNNVIYREINNWFDDHTGIRILSAKMSYSTNLAFSTIPIALEIRYIEIPGSYTRYYYDYCHRRGIAKPPVASVYRDFQFWKEDHPSAHIVWDSQQGYQVRSSMFASTALCCWLYTKDND